MAFSCSDLTKDFRTPRGTTRALDDISIRVADGEFVCVVGPSGCGKTTLLRVFAGLVGPSGGSVAFEGGAVGGTLVFQEHGIYEWMSVVDNVAFGLEAAGVGKRERRSRAEAFMARLGLAEFATAFPHELSVGMRQRVALARTFLTGSKNLLMDEPFGSLDAQTKIVLQQELLQLWGSSRASVLFVTHDIEEAVALGDRVVVMTGRPGRIREDLRVELPRPRGVGPEKSPEAQPIEWHVWRLLKEEVYSGLGIQS